MQPPKTVSKYSIKRNGELIRRAPFESSTVAWLELFFSQDFASLRAMTHFRSHPITLHCAAFGVCIKICCCCCCTVPQTLSEVQKRALAVLLSLLCPLIRLHCSEPLCLTLSCKADAQSTCIIYCVYYTHCVKCIC